MKKMKNFFVKNGENYIHVIESGNPQKSDPTLLVIVGIWESAERAIPVHNLDRHVISFSFRGRGLSSTPSSGYTLEDHLSDIEVVVQACGLNDYCVLGFSRGAAYTLAWYFKNRTDIAGLILVDQAPIHRRIPKENLEFWCNMVYQNVPTKNHMRNSAFEGLCRDANDHDFTEELDTIDVPVRIFYGTSEQSEIPSNLTEDIKEIYALRIKNVSFIVFELSGHMIPDDEPEKYLIEIEKFMNTLIH